MTKERCTKCGGTVTLVGLSKPEASKGVYMQYKCRKCGATRIVSIKPEEEKEP